MVDRIGEFAPIDRAKVQSDIADPAAPAGPTEMIAAADLAVSPVPVVIATYAPVDAPNRAPSSRAVS
jgi:hypothetical protein